jgi:hypothetical protein
MKSKEKRAKRRAKSIAYGTRARATHLHFNHPDGVLDCVCEQSVWFFAKSKSNGCDCRGRTHGNPKYGYGICVHSGKPRAAVGERIDGKRQVKEALKLARSGVHHDDLLP